MKESQWLNAFGIILMSLGFAQYLHTGEKWLANDGIIICILGITKELGDMG